MQLERSSPSNICLVLYLLLDGGVFSNAANNNNCNNIHVATLRGAQGGRDR